MNKYDLLHRTKLFALNIIQFVGTMKKGMLADVLGKQLLRCATSIGANYRSACRARSRADFISKIAIVEEEAAETIYWLELIKESDITRDIAINSLIDEANELTAIFTSTGKTAKSNKFEIRHQKSEIKKGGKDDTGGIS
ncbi:MAG: four helix bundle protein [Nitrospinae bacterium]|nr:four helix bundle protein [Nitrospinota bacterium]